MMKKDAYVHQTWAFLASAPMSQRRRSHAYFLLGFISVCRDDLAHMTGDHACCHIQLLCYVEKVPQVFRPDLSPPAQNLLVIQLTLAQSLLLLCS